jgi:signal peptidase
MSTVPSGWGVRRGALHLCLALLLASAVASLLFLGVGPRTGRYRTLTVLTGSMAPHFPPGSLVVDTPEPVGHVRPGQVVTFHAPTAGRQVVTHRVTRVLADPGTAQPVVETKGDANPVGDGWDARLEGGTAWRARFAVPYVGYALIFLHTAGRGLWLVFPALLAAVCLFDIWAGDGRREQVAVAG